MTMERMIVRGTPPNRVHVFRALDWNRAAGTDYWMIPATNDELTAAATNAEILSNVDWTTTTLTHTVGTLGNLLAALSQATSYGPVWTTAAAAAEIRSPAIFGGPEQAQMAAMILGYTPTQLVLEWIARFSVNATGETTSALGFATGVITTAGNAVGTIYSDGTNFKVRTSAATSTAGAAVDTNFHRWKIILDSVALTVTGFMDGAVIGAAAGIALTNTLFPTSIAAGNATAGNNRVQPGIAHVYYQ